MLNRAEKYRLTMWDHPIWRQKIHVHKNITSSQLNDIRKSFEVLVKLTSLGNVLFKQKKYSVNSKKLKHFFLNFNPMFIGHRLIYAFWTINIIVANEAWENWSVWYGSQTFVWIDIEIQYWWEMFRGEKYGNYIIR